MDAVKKLKRPRNFRKKGLTEDMSIEQMHAILAARQEEHRKEREKRSQEKEAARRDRDNARQRERYHEARGDVPVKPPVPVETDEQVDARISERFTILNKFTYGALRNEVKALIVSGPPGLGKSFTVETILKEVDPDEERYTVVKGYVRPVELYKQMWEHRAPGQVLVFDDADSIFHDDVSLNILKAGCDSTENRVISYLSNYLGLVSDVTGEDIPKHFKFEGTIIFITNYDFDAIVEKGQSKLIPHLQALISRAHYIDLTMRTKQDYLVRIRQVADQGMFGKAGLNLQQEVEVMEFIRAKADNLRELSLRMAIKLAGIRRLHADNWERLAIVTCCKTK